MKHSHDTVRAMLPEQHLITQIERFLKATSMGPTEFGKKVLGDAKFMYELRKGRQVRLETRKKVYDYIAAAAVEISAVKPRPWDVEANTMTADELIAEEP